MFAKLFFGLMPILHLVRPASFTSDTYKKDTTALEVTSRFATKSHGSHAEFDSAGHWFSYGWHVGASKNLDFLIDTGSSDCLIGSYYYHKGPSAKYTGKNFTITYYPHPQNNTVTGKIYEDRVSFAGLSFPTQKIGIFPSKNTGVQGGIIGFAGPKASSFDNPSWFYSLSEGGYLDQRRFGLAFGTNKTGKQIIGAVDNSLFKGSLVNAPRINKPMQFWSVMGDVAIGGKIIDKDALLVLDAGTDRIFGPVPKIRKIFDQLGYSYTYHPGKKGHPLGYPSFIKATFPCDATLPLGFSIPSAKTSSDAAARGETTSKPQIFDIGQSYWGPPNADGNCTSILWGSNQFTAGFDFGDNGWLVGQAFFEGHYIDHNLGAQTMGFANLVNTKNPGSP